MLRASAAISSTDVDLHVVNGELTDNDAVPFSNELVNFATAVVSRDEQQLTESRERLLAVANAEVLVDAAAVAGNFQRMVRIADSIGIPVDTKLREFVDPAVDALELRRFKTAEHTPV